MNKYQYTFSVRLLFSILLLSSELISQVNYPTDSSFISTLSNEQKNNYQLFTYSKIDTNITNIQNYFPRNTNGNFGLSSTPLLFDYQSKALGFNLYNAPYDIDMIKTNQVDYYQTKGPYASLTGIARGKVEQTFKLLFSNTFRNKLNITLGFNRYSSLGFLYQQQSFTNNLVISSNYTSKNNRVGFYSYFLYNKLKHQENGGIKNDSLILNNAFIPKNLLGINLSNSKREARFANFNLDTWFRLNKRKDSTAVVSHYVNYGFNYSGNYTKYKDQGIHDDKYYPVYYLDTISTMDSTHWRNFANSVSYSLRINPLNTRLEFGLKNEYNQVHQHTDSLFMNNFFNAGVFVNKEKFNAFFKLNYLFSGANANDLQAEFGSRTKLKYIFGDKNYSKTGPVYFNLNANYESRHPDFIYNTWLCNNFNWSNAFVPTQKFQSILSFSTNDKRFDLGVIYQNTKNMLYFNEQAIPEQSSASISNVSLFIHKNLLLFKHLGINAQCNYQLSSYQAIVSMPNHVVNSALYYQGNLFKRALQIQIGFNVQYYSSFNGLAYMPATNMYYVQTQSTVGNYPYVDFFLNARIKPVRVFIKIDHLNQGFSGSQYYLVPGYLQSDRSLKFGINWLFFD